MMRGHLRRLAHLLSHLIVWRACDCYALPDPAREARLAAFARQWEQMDAHARREAFGALRRSL